MSFIGIRAQALMQSSARVKASNSTFLNRGISLSPTRYFRAIGVLPFDRNVGNLDKFLLTPNKSDRNKINFSAHNSGFHTTAELYYRQKVQQSYSSILKHKKPDGLSGAERRQKMIKEAKNQRFSPKPLSKNTRGFVPTKFQLTDIPSDKKAPPKKIKLTYETLSARKKFNEREKDRLAKGVFKQSGSPVVKSATKFDMADLETLDNLKKKVAEARFDDLALVPELTEAIYKLFPNIPRENLRPTEIQALAIPELLKEKNAHVLCAAETGTGKTLSYLVPIINRLKTQEASSKAPHIPKAHAPKRNVDFGTDAEDPFLNGTVGTNMISKSEEMEGNAILSDVELRLLTITPFRKLNRPRALVLVPSCVLVDQVYAVCKVLSHTVKFRAVALTRKTVRKDLLRRLTSPIDLLVATPASLERYLSEGILSVSELQSMVIDEADTMFEKGFGDEVRNLISSLVNSCKNQKKPYQLAVVSATLPKMVLQNLESKFPDLLRITTPSLHKALPKCKQYFVDLKDYKGNRSLGLLDVLRQFEQRSTASPKKKELDRILVFCNTRKSVTIVQAFLRERKIDCISIYGGTPIASQPPASPEQLHAFLYPSTERVAANYDFSIPERTSTKPKKVRSSRKSSSEDTDNGASTASAKSNNEHEEYDDADEELAGQHEKCVDADEYLESGSEEYANADADADSYEDYEYVDEEIDESEISGTTDIGEDPAAEPKIKSALSPKAAPTAAAETPATIPKILICSDIASRGLDTTSVNHVIMYDFPIAALDYLHRCGRTARANQSGTVTSLIGKKDRALAERIRRSIKTNTVLS